MSTQTEEIITYFKADVSGLEEGQRKINTQFDAFLRKQRGMVQGLDKMTGSGGALGSTLNKLSDLAKGGAARLTTLAGAAGTLVALAFREAKKEADRSAESIAGLSAEAALASNRLSRLSKESDLGELAAQFEAARKQAAAFRKEQGERGNPWMSGGVFEGLGRTYNNLKDAVMPGRSIGDTNAQLDTDFDLAGKASAQDQVKSQRLIRDYLRDQAALVKDVAEGNTDTAAIRVLEIARQREINDLVRIGLKTQENEARVTEKYAAQIDRIKQDRLRSTFYAQDELLIIELMAKGASDIAEQERLRARYSKEINQLRLSGGSQEELSALQERQDLEERMLENRRRVDRMQFDAQMSVARLSASNLSDGSKAIKAAEMQLAAVREQLSLAKELNLTLEQRRSLALQEQTLVGSLKSARQDRDFDLRFRPGDRNARDARDRREAIERDKFDAAQSKSGGLQNLHRDASGNPVSGIDPATGQRVPFPGAEGAPKSLAEQVRATGTFGSTALGAGPTLTSGRSLSELTKATGIFGADRSIRGYSSQEQGPALSAGAAAMQLAGSKDFLGSKKVSAADKALVAQLASLQTLQDIRKVLSE